jgi:hypothetical protein
MRYTDKQALVDKVDWEGGVAVAILDYGISSDELPEDTPDEIVEAWKVVEAAKGALVKIDKWMW